MIVLGGKILLSVWKIYTLLGGIMMQYGVHLFATEDSIQPGELAQQAESRGYDTVLFSEHTHIPVDFLKYNEAGRNLKNYYWQAYDPFIAATIAAASTTNIKIGTGVSLILQHDPITLAKEVATCDQISSGRFIFGIGTGWIPGEMENHGVSYHTRYKYIQEHVQAMKSIWNEEEPEFRGKYINFSKIKSNPKPVQSPHPPLISGGGVGPKSLEFIARHCDGWMPILGYPDWAQIKQGISDLHHRVESIDRDPACIELSIFAWSLPDRETIDDMEASGIRAIITSLEAKNREEALPLLDKYIVKD
jgi:probable F420-dependent oxidoreductase